MEKTQKEFYERHHEEHKPHAVTQMVFDEKRRVISDFINTSPWRRSKILFVGCGNGEDLEVAAAASVGVDLSLSGLKNARTNYPGHDYVVCDACRLPLESESFDVIVCSEVIEHIPEPAVMVQEFFRIIRKDGLLIITTPNWISLYGLARKTGEWILRRPITSADQPVDHWYTYGSIEAQLLPYFTVSQCRGVWFFPPIGIGYRTLPVSMMASLFRRLLPFERTLQKMLPCYAHLLAIAFSPKK